MEPKYPNIQVQLTGQNGNAFAIIGLVKAALRRAEVPKAEIDEFVESAMSGDYDNLLRVAMETVDVQ